jgi:bifunctional enzyme CysN/CysC
MFEVQDRGAEEAQRATAHERPDLKKKTVAAAIPEIASAAYILTCGSVDDGKSTLIGRLLWDAGDLPEDTRESMLKRRKPNGELDLSLLLDGLAAEREQGITIDIAWRYFDTNSGRRFVIIDSPGHEQYTRNMASGASHADVAIMLVDARAGIKIQTRRHAAILHLVGVKRVILAVNKMDLVDWSEDRFREIEREFARVAAPLAFEEAVAVPLSAKHGSNVARRSVEMDWYEGPTLLDLLHATRSRETSTNGRFRFPIQTVIRDNDFRGLAGTISSGTVKPGDEIRDVLTGRAARIERIVTMSGDLTYAQAGQAVVLTLDRDLDISRGSVLVSEGAAAQPASQIEGHVIWLADAPLRENSGLWLRSATDAVPVSNLRVKSRVDLENLSEGPTGDYGPNDIVTVEIDLAREIALDLFEANRETGSFILIDAETGTTVAGGVVRQSSANRAARKNAFKVTAEFLAREICAGLSRDSVEFRRRADAVLGLLTSAGVDCVYEG